MTADSIVQTLNLQPHPEGGFYKESYRSEGRIGKDALPSTFNGERSYSTAIYYLLQRGDFSAFHRIKSDEVWHHYAGGTLLIHCLSEETGYSVLRLGKDLTNGEQFQHVVPAGVWFASEPPAETEFVLAGCTVSPGFDFADFELAEKAALRKSFPAQDALVGRLCR